MQRLLSAEKYLDNDLTRFLKDTEHFQEALSISRLGPHVPRKIQFGIGETYLRLKGHNRSLCRILSPSSRRTIFDSPALIIKGTEPLATNAEQHVKRLCKDSKQADFCAAEHFAFVERKTPLALTLVEAQAEFHAGIRVHNKHWRAYGFQAEMPVPLFVHRLTDLQTKRFARLLQSTLPSLVFKTCAESSKLEFACITFYSDYVPTRILSPFGDYLKHTRGALSDIEVENKLVSLFARILVLGELPWTPLNETSGSCFDPKNATHRGGICDLDSFVPFELAPSKTFLKRSLSGSIHRLFATLCFHSGITERPDKKQISVWKHKLSKSLDIAHNLAFSRHAVSRRILSQVKREVADLVIRL